MNIISYSPRGKLQYFAKVWNFYNIPCVVQHVCIPCRVSNPIWFQFCVFLKIIIRNFVGCCTNIFTTIVYERKLLREKDSLQKEGKIKSTEYPKYNSKTRSPLKLGPNTYTKNLYFCYFESLYLMKLRKVLVYIEVVQ